MAVATKSLTTGLSEMLYLDVHVKNIFYLPIDIVTEVLLLGSELLDM